MSSAGGVWRERHRLAVLLAGVPLTVTVLSAFLYRVLHSVLGVERSSVRWLIQVHQGTYFGIDAVVYTLLNGLLTLGVVLTAAQMLLSLRASYARVNSQQPLFPWPVRSWRDAHRLQSAFSLAALAWAAISGAGYRFLRNQVGLEKDQIGWLLDWHHFNFVNGLGSIVWCVVCGSFVLTAIVTGVRMHPKLLGRRFQSNANAINSNEF